LSTVPGSPFSSGTNLYLAVDYLNRFVFAADEDPPGGVLAFTIDSSTGALTAVPASPFPISANSTGVPQLSQIVVDPSGKFVYVALTSTNQVAAFAVASTGALTPVLGSPFAAGKGPLALTIFDNASGNNFLYLSNALDGTVSGYSVDASSGVLTPLGGSPFPIPAAALTADLGLGHLYVSSPAGMLSFSISPRTGALIPIGLPVSFTGATVMAYVQ
jgi:6-phosphogluconolactonase